MLPTLERTYMIAAIRAPVISHLPSVAAFHLSFGMAKGQMMTFPRTMNSMGPIAPRKNKHNHKVVFDFHQLGGRSSSRFKVVMIVVLLAIGIVVAWGPG